jgi:DNA-binding transcriptional ArsR family regulator
MNPAIPIDAFFPDPTNVEQAAAAVLDDASASELADFFRIMADPTRVRIFSALAGAELCVTDLRLILNMEQSAVSHQLRALREWGLVRCRKAGRQVFYSLDPEHTPDFFIASLNRARSR